MSMQPAPGKLTGTGVIYDADGNVKSEFTIESDVPPEQAEQAKAMADSVNQENQDGTDTHDSV